MNRFIFLILFIWLPSLNLAHPGGNMIAAGDYLLWSYVVPFYDGQHHSSVLAYDGNEVEIIITSEFASSDFFLSYQDGWVYYLESYSLENKLFFRVLRGKPGTTPAEFMPWTEDNWLTGRNGFYFNMDNEIIFCKYPDIFLLKEGEEASRIYSTTDPVRRLINLPDGKLLLLCENSVEYLDQDFSLITRWQPEPGPKPEDPPLDREMMFDAYLSGTDLILADWGRRALIGVMPDGDTEVLFSVDKPFTVHWCVEWKGDIYAFCSRINPPETIIPALYRISDNKNIWSAPGVE